MPLRHIGTILRTHGTDGSVFVGEASPTLELPVGTTIHIGFSGQFSSPYKIKSLKAANRGLLLLVEGITTPEAASKLREEGVFVEESLLDSGKKDE